MKSEKDAGSGMIKYGKYLNSIDKNRLPLAALTSASLSFSEIVFSVLIVRYIIDAYTTNQFDIGEFVIIMCLALVFQIGVWAIESYYYEYYSIISDTKIIGHINEELFVLLKRMPLKRIEKSDYYQKYYFVINDVENRVSEYWGLIESITGTVVTIVSLVGIVVVAEPLLILLFLFPVIIDVLITPLLNRRKYEYDVSKKEEDRKGEYTQRVMYIKDYAKDMRLTSISKVVLKQYEEYVYNVISLIHRKMPKIVRLESVISMSYQVVSFFSVIVLVCYRVCSGTMALSDGVVIISLYNQIVYSLKNVINLYSEVNRQSQYIRDFFSFKQYGIENVNNFTKHIVSIKSIESVRFDHVSFTYDGENIILKDISFEARRGQKIAILGENGAGKSTLVKLLLNLYQAETGTVYINDLEIERISETDYLELVGQVMQDYRLFSMSIYKNISENCLDDKPNYEWLEEAMRLGGFYEIYDKLGHNMDAILTKEFDDNGIVLSGGQAQKLAITRAIAKQKDMLILDEPTSNLDPIAEAKFFDVIKNNFNDRIVFFVSHNYSFGKMADCILFIEDGRIAEKGTHNELMEKDGRYASMYKMQAANFQGWVKDNENSI